MSIFANMASQLVGKPQLMTAHISYRYSTDRLAKVGPVAKVRAYLEKNGPATAAVLADVAGITSAMVSAVLKHDRQIGRVSVFQQDGQQMYRFDGGDPAILRMVRSLEAMGYTVTAP